MEVVEDNAPGNIVRLAEYRKRRREATGRRRPPGTWGAQYYCLRCDADEFRLYASGNVHCAQCGAFMRNLELTVGTEEA